jgi:hypothetical protein
MTAATVTKRSKSTDSKAAPAEHKPPTNCCSLAGWQLGGTLTAATAATFECALQLLGSYLDVAAVPCKQAVLQGNCDAGQDVSQASNCIGLYAVLICQLPT